MEIQEARKQLLFRLARRQKKMYTGLIFLLTCDIGGLTAGGLTLGLHISGLHGLQPSETSAQEERAPEGQKGPNNKQQSKSANSLDLGVAGYTIIVDEVFGAHPSQGRRSSKM